MYTSLIESSLVRDWRRLASTPKPTSINLSSNKIPEHFLLRVTTEAPVPRNVIDAIRSESRSDYLDLLLISVPTIPCQNASRQEGAEIMSNALSKRSNSGPPSDGDHSWIRKATHKWQRCSPKYLCSLG